MVKLLKEENSIIGERTDNYEIFKIPGMYLLVHVGIG